jgi:uncharacterized membrane protein
MKKILILTSFIITAILLLSGCQVAEPEAEVPEEQPLITQYSGIINEVRENEMLVYVITEYSGEMIARWNEETKIDDSLKPLIKPDNLVTFTTNGIMTRSIPPQVIVTSIDSVLEGVVFEGTVTEISDNSITVEMTHPRKDRVIARITPDTVFAEGVSEDIKVGSIVRFETNGMMQPSEPPQVNVVRFTKNEVPETPSSDFYQKKIGKGIVFFATGNEPSWTLDYDKYYFVFTTMSGFELHVPLFEPVETGEDGSFEFKGETEAGTIEIFVTKENCADTMSGELFTHKVSIDAKAGADNDITRYEGCGKYLTGSM